MIFAPVRCLHEQVKESRVSSRTNTGSEVTS
jgi:hypothetical protein